MKKNVSKEVIEGYRRKRKEWRIFTFWLQENQKIIDDRKRELISVVGYEWENFRKDELKNTYQKRYNTGKTIGRI